MKQSIDILYSRHNSEDTKWPHTRTDPQNPAQPFLEMTWTKSQAATALCKRRHLDGSSEWPWRCVQSWPWDGCGHWIEPEQLDDLVYERRVLVVSWLTVIGLLHVILGVAKADHVIRPPGNKVGTGTLEKKI